jgi:threonine/homoserine/homoserine lactone efflux protein
MTLHLWLSFAAASLLMGLVPGPGVMSILGYAIHSGRRTALASVAGMAVGNMIAMSLSLAGVGALLAASAAAFLTLKWIGALYLIGLGVRTIVRSKMATKADMTSTRAAVSPAKAFAGNVLVGTFHPKTIVLFVAFAPQFINGSYSYAVQASILVVTFTAVVACSDAVYALLASRASGLFRSPSYATWSRRLGGGVMVAAGAATAAAKS